MMQLHNFFSATEAGLEVTALRSGYNILNINVWVLFGWPAQHRWLEKPQITKLCAGKRIKIILSKRNIYIKKHNTEIIPVVSNVIDFVFMEDMGMCVSLDKKRQVERWGEDERWTQRPVCGVYPGGVGLQGSQVILQGQTAPIIQHGLHPGEVSLHQLLLLAGCLLLQGLHHGLEVLQTKAYTYINLYTICTVNSVA